MADLADVLNGVRDEAAAALDAAGLTQPGQESGGVRIYRGWPGERLDADIASNVTHVTIYPRAGMATTMDGRIGGYVERSGAPAAMTAGVDGATVTFTGTDPRLGLIAGVAADGRAWTVVLTAGMGPDAMAAAFAAAISPDRPATSTGAVLTLPGAVMVRAGVYAGGTEILELRRQEQGVLLTVWAPSAALRDRIAAVLDAHFSDDYGRRTRVMPDGSRTTIRYNGTAFDDQGRLHPIYRRDLAVSAEYSTTNVRVLPPVVATKLVLQPPPPAPAVTREG